MHFLHSSRVQGAREPVEEACFFCYEEKMVGRSGGLTSRSDGVSCVLSGSDMIVYGGSVANKVWLLSLETSSWREQVCTGAVPPPRLHHSACVFGDTMCVYGGEVCDTAGDVDESPVPYYELDIPTFTWRAVRTHGESPGCRSHHTGSLVSGMLYVVGGRATTTGSRAATQTVASVSADLRSGFFGLHILDIVNRTWRVVERVDSLHPAVWGHSTCVFRHYVLVFGGFDVSVQSDEDPTGPPSAVLSSSVYSYDTVSLVWRVLSQKEGVPHPAARALHVAVTCLAEMYVFGGLGVDDATGSSLTLNDCWRWDIASGMWTAVTDFCVQSFHAKRLLSVVHHSRLIVCGGVGSFHALDLRSKHEGWMEYPCDARGLCKKPPSATAALTAAASPAKASHAASSPIVPFYDEQPGAPSALATAAAAAAAAATARQSLSPDAMAGLWGMAEASVSPQPLPPPQRPGGGAGGGVDHTAEVMGLHQQLHALQGQLAELTAAQRSSLFEQAGLSAAAVAGLPEPSPQLPPMPASLPPAPIADAATEVEMLQEELRRLQEEQQQRGQAQAQEKSSLLHEVSMRHAAAAAAAAASLVPQASATTEPASTPASLPQANPHAAFVEQQYQQHQLQLQQQQLQLQQQQQQQHPQFLLPGAAQPGYPPQQPSLEEVSAVIAPRHPYPAQQQQQLQQPPQQHPQHPYGAGMPHEPAQPSAAVSGEARLRNYRRKKAADASASERSRSEPNTRSSSTVADHEKRRIQHLYGLQERLREIEHGVGDSTLGDDSVRYAAAAAASAAGVGVEGAAGGGSQQRQRSLASDAAAVLQQQYSAQQHLQTQMADYQAQLAQLQQQKQRQEQQQLQAQQILQQPQYSLPPAHAQQPPPGPPPVSDRQISPAPKDPAEWNILRVCVRACVFTRLVPLL